MTEKKWGKRFGEIYCQEVAENLSAYYDGDIPPELCAQIEAHVKECGDCTIVLNTFSKTIELYKDEATESQLPEDVKGRLHAVLDLTEPESAESD